MRRANRGQTLNDFAIGMALFMLTVAFVVAFIPTMYAPFDAPGEDGDAIRADRAASRLLGTVLADPSGELQRADRTCTVAFFDGVAHPDCTDTGVSLIDATGLGTTDTVYVAVKDPGGTVQSLDGVTLERGEPSPGSSNGATVRRMIVLNGDQYTMEVEVW